MYNSSLTAPLEILDIPLCAQIPTFIYHRNFILTVSTQISK